MGDSNRAIHAGLLSRARQKLRKPPAKRIVAIQQRRRLRDVLSFYFRFTRTRDSLLATDSAIRRDLYAD